MKPKKKNKVLAEKAKSAFSSLPKEKEMKVDNSSVVRAFRVKKSNYKILTELAEKDGSGSMYYGGITFHLNKAIEEYGKKRLKK